MSKNTDEWVSEISDELLDSWIGATLEAAEIYEDNDSIPEDLRAVATKLLRMSYPVHALKAFRPDSLPDEVKGQYLYWLVEYEKTQNAYYVIRIFTEFVRNGINPPKWVLEFVAQGFRQQILDSDPIKLAKQMGLVGRESGADSPAAEFERRNSRSAAMADMVKLIEIYGLGQLAAAEAVKDKHRLTASKHTLKKFYVEYFDGATAEMPDIKETELAVFVSTFPPRIRRKMKRVRP